MAGVSLGSDAPPTGPAEDPTGSKASAEQFFPAVYDQLRAAARRSLADERQGHTLQATALVHEAYVRLAGERRVPWQGRAHFYAAAAEAMRRILVDHARARAADRRGGDARRAARGLEGLPDLSSPEESAGFLILEEAISRLEVVDAKSAEVVRLRYFAGLDVDETAAALGVSAPSVKRAWAFARAWLRTELDGDG